MARSMDSPKLTANAQTVLERRYLKKDEQGSPIETAEDLFHRVAADIAAAELSSSGHAGLWEEKFYDSMVSLDFLPNSPTLMNAGRELQQLAACFVLPIDDSLDSIFDMLKLTAKIHQSGGGTGFSFSRLRPRGDRVKTTGGVSSGPVSFLEVYDAATEHIKQGSFRRGANMGILDVTHPDIEEFIRSKTENGITNFNISVGVTEEWMDAAARSEPYDLINPRTGKPVGQLNAGEVLGAIAEAAWTNGDPGIVFLDRMNEPRTNPTPALGPIVATNPCGEQPLLPFEACVLGSINLGHFVTGEAVDWERMGEMVSIAVRFLDNAVERSSYPIPEIREMHKEGNRKIGLGVMGWADMLVSMEIPYDSEEALELASGVMEFISATADAVSEELAGERGSFSNWEESVYGREGQNRPMRNATRTTIAPTGTISILAGCSSGIEPLFALSFHRKVMEGTVLTEVNTAFERVMREAGAWSETIAEDVAIRAGTRGLDDVPESIQRLFPTAHEIAPYWHVRHQAAFQRHVDSAVSKTINLPKDATIEDVAFSLELAHELGCKGITVYRDGSRSWQVLNKGRLAGTDLGTIEGSPPAFGEDEHVMAPMRGQSVLEVCPMCGLPSFEFAETCGKCHSCGHSTC
ncbi:MAG: adenosylcobalamin-dependent ribonucleoside-diphosphate reductase [Actinobacteria bacterium]|nr:adenosylcobalamin-dependent ribonucleoside-diphosphate reductase [Actinomycetota bacterium]